MLTSRFSPVTAFAGRTASVARQDARAVVEADVVDGPLAKSSRKAPANATIAARHIPLPNTDPTGPNSYTRSTGCRENRTVGRQDTCLRQRSGMTPELARWVDRGEGFEDSGAVARRGVPAVPEHGFVDLPVEA